MHLYTVLLRAVNVGGTGKLPMDELRSLCRDLGFGNVRSYIQSGNLVMASDLDAGGVKDLLERELSDRMEKEVQVLVRTPDEMVRILEGNPYPDAAPNRVLVLFLDEPVPPGIVDSVVSPGGEQLTSGDREVYIHYPDGQGRSKLKVPMASEGTARNLNTVRKLVEMCNTE